MAREATLSNGGWTRTSTMVIVTALMGVAVACFWAQRSSPPELDWETFVLPLARQYAKNSDENSPTPLQGKIIAITGSTSGIGLALTRILSKLGATVLAIGRSTSKLQQLQDELSSVQVYQADLTNLESVAQMAQEMRKDHWKIDILVNNAGMHAMLDLSFQPGPHNTDASGKYDRVFVTNYLSHFLLTELLLEDNTLTHRVVQTSSSYHFAVDGSDLQVHDDLEPVVAARPGGSTGFLLFRTQRSYANSKLAQLYHMRALQQHYPKLDVVSFCPGWVATHIGGGAQSVFTKLLEQLAFPANGWGVASALKAILGEHNQDEASSQDEQADYYNNSQMFDLGHYIFAIPWPAWTYAYVPLRDMVGSVFAGVALLLQSWKPTAAPTKSSLESYNTNTAQALYEWSLQAVAPYLLTPSETVVKEH